MLLSWNVENLTISPRSWIEEGWENDKSSFISSPSAALRTRSKLPLVFRDVIHVVAKTLGKIFSSRLFQSTARMTINLFLCSYLLHIVTLQKKKRKRK